MEFAGEFETHFTICPDASESMPKLQEWAVSQKMKCLQIVLDRGVTVSQPMLTRRGQGKFSHEFAIASGLSQAMQEVGFSVIRLKIEAAPWNEGVPQSEKDALALPPAMYFEHHIKVLIDPDATMEALTASAERYGARLSRNALKVRSDRFQERFITQRCWAVGRAKARQQLDALAAAIIAFGYPLLDVEEEFVVYDSNLSLDAGWLREKEL